MAIILRSQVEVMGGLVSIGAKSAIMDLHDDGRFVLVRVDLRSQQWGETLIDAPVRSLRVNSGSTYLTINAGGVKRRVDFAGESPVGFALFGLIGAAISRSFAEKAGLDAWIETFRAQGVLGRLNETVRNVLILVGIGVGVALAIVITAAVVQ